MNNRKIFCHNNDNNSYVDFYDFEYEGQLQEFASLFAKITGAKITEYWQGPGTTLVNTELNNDDINILWDDMCGCMVYAENSKRTLLVVIAYKMLCEKYLYYDSYKELFNNIGENNEKIIVKHNDYLANISELSESKKSDIIHDISDLIEFIEK